LKSRVTAEAGASPLLPSAAAAASREATRRVHTDTGAASSIGVWTVCFRTRGVYCVTTSAERRVYIEQTARQVHGGWCRHAGFAPAALGGRGPDRVAVASGALKRLAIRHRGRRCRQEQRPVLAREQRAPAVLPTDAEPVRERGGAQGVAVAGGCARADRELARPAGHTLTTHRLPPQQPSAARMHADDCCPHSAFISMHSSAYSSAPSSAKMHEHLHPHLHRH